MKAWLQAWLKPCRFSIEAHGNIKRQFSLSPLWLPAGIICLCLLVALVTWQTTVSHGKIERLERRNYQLLHDNEQLRSRLAKAEAERMLREEQLKQQQRLLSRQKQEIIPLRKRLSLLESILLKRRDKGTHILTASAGWKGKRLQLNIVLVKGGNYPREVEGTIEVLAPKPEGAPVRLPLANDRERLKYRMKTHALLEQTLDWPYDWRPNQLFLILNDRHDREIERITVWLGGNHD